MWRWIAVLGAVPIGAAALVAAVGALLPREHVAAAETVLAAEPGWAAEMIRNVERHPRWRSGVRGIRILGRSPAGIEYVEQSDDGEIAFRLVEERPGARFRSTIADPELPFGGYWLFRLSPEGAGTRLRIEEHGFVGNPIFRFVARFVFGHERNIRRYLADLEAAAARSPISAAPS
jgi:hypothetical protein